MSFLNSRKFRSSSFWYSRWFSVIRSLFFSKASAALQSTKVKTDTDLVGQLDDASKGTIVQD